MNEEKIAAAKSVLRAINELLAADRHQEALAIIDSGRQLALDGGDRELAATFVLTRAEIHVDQNEPERARDCLNDVVFDAAGTEAEAQAWYQLGAIARAEADRETAANMFLRAASAFDRVSRPEGEALATQAAGECRMELGQHQKALSALKRSSDRWGDTGDMPQVVYIGILYADCLAAVGRMDDALSAIAEAVTGARMLGNSQLSALAGRSMRNIELLGAQA